MSESPKCPRCGAELPADGPGGHCISCLLQLGLAAAPDATPTATIRIVPPGQMTTEKPGDRIGRYKLLQQIGEGGCGVVYMAEQAEPMRRRVALKVIKLGMDTKQVIARFEAERQALALMDHPNIAKVLDAGATDAGRPYFVMELVRGIKITDYCDEQRLSTRQRLELFVQVCRAVQHAHQKGIIHRDLKPSNILVTEQDGKAVPKIIDFGIAKATTAAPLTDKTLFTAFDQFIGTPAYMSPEQAGLGGLDIDTRSDVYSLGVLLYELLTGKQPFDTAALRRSAIDEILRTIREQAPQRPSARLTVLTEQELTLVARRRQSEPAKYSYLLRGDLDWIVMKTLEKDRARRYETANGLAVDIQRHLKNEPVVARPPSALYRFQTLFRRHKLALGSASVVLATLVAGLVVSSWSFFQEQDAHRHADEQSRRASAAEKDGREQIWHSQLTQAQALRWSHRAGRRFDSLDLLKKAAEYRPSTELRNEAIACLAVTDLRPTQSSTNDFARSAVSAFDDSFERCAIGDERGNVSVREAQSGRELMSLPGVGSSVSDLVFTPDNRLLAVIYGVYRQNNHGLQIWDLASQRVVALKPAVTNCRSLCFSSDSSKVVVAQFANGIGKAPEPTLLYDLKSGLPIRSFASASLAWGLTLNPTSTKLAVSSTDNTHVIVQDVTSQRVIWSLPHPQGVSGMAWNSLGNQLVTACMDGQIYLWDMNSGGLVRIFSRHESAAIGVSFNHHNHLLASTGWDGCLRLWNALTGEEICNWPCEWEQYYVKFSSDDRQLNVFSSMKRTAFEISGDDGTNVLKFINTGDQEIWSCAYSADGHVLASTHTDGVRVWDSRTGALIGFQALPGVNAVTFDRMGTILYTDSDDALRQWPLRWLVEAGTNKLSFGTAENISARPNFDRYCRPFDQPPTTAALVSNGKVHLVDLASRREKNVLTATKPFGYASLSHNGRWCAASSYDDANVTVFELSNSIALKVLPAALQAKTMAFSPNNRWLVTGDNQQFQFWDTAGWKCVFALPRTATAAGPGVVAFSSDSLLVAVTISAQLVRLMDTANGNQLATLESSAPQNIGSMEFSPNGSQLAMLGYGPVHYLQLWDLRLLREQLAAMKLDW